MVIITSKSVGPLEEDLRKPLNFEASVGVESPEGEPEIGRCSCRVTPLFVADGTLPMFYQVISPAVHCTSLYRIPPLQAVLL
jgi:hypothetical protein